MESPEAQFMAIVNKLTSSDPDIFLGKMMHSPGLKYKDKVFAFYHKNEMGFRLGPKFDSKKFGLKNIKPLSPFKKKPPLKGWFLIESYESNLWETLSEMALDFTKTI